MFILHPTRLFVSMWTEKYSPRSIIELLSNESQFFNLAKIILNLNFFNYLIHGPYGIGKTIFGALSTRELFNLALKHDIVKFDGLDNNSMSSVRKKLKYFIESNFLRNERKKLVIIDNADKFSFSGQLGLRENMERQDRNLSFWLFCNSSNKINPTILSRCVLINLKPCSGLHLCIRLHEIAEKEKFKWQIESLIDSLFHGNGDIRKTINIAMHQKLIESKNVFPTLLKQQKSCHLLIRKLLESFQKDQLTVFSKKINCILKNNHVNFIEIYQKLQSSFINTTIFCPNQNNFSNFRKVTDVFFENIFYIFLNFNATNVCVKKERF